MTPTNSSFVLPPGLHVFERGWLSANNILFTGGEQTALVDSGYCTHAEQTLALVKEVLKGQPLDLLVNTHLHSDHCGGNALLQSAYPGLRTLIPPGHADEVARWDGLALTHETTGQLCPRFSFSGTLPPGSALTLGQQRWEIHAAGGHDPHSIVLFQPEARTLLSADALWENGFGVIFPELDGEEGFTEVGLTLDLIESLKPDLVVPGHGPVFRYGPEVMARARERLDFFAKHPEKHALHGLKVLLKFKLLEVQHQQLESFIDWAASTPYFVTIRQRFFDRETIKPWLISLCDSLVKSRVARIESGVIINA